MVHKIPADLHYEAAAFQAGVRATGYVVNHAANQFIASHWYHYPIDRVRQRLKEAILSHLPMSQTSPWIVALAVGERQGIPTESWQVLRNTGTNHLMAIAGLHIGCMAGVAHSSVAWLWRRAPSLLLKMPAMHAGAIAALIMAVTYSALAGFSLPTERACIMLTVLLTTVLWRRKTLAWQAWSLAMLAVLILNPLDVVTDSFWLSFASWR